MIISLAGHVDHGKTSLVEALSGKNTDSLAEEQRRGLTIDIGFAYIHRDNQTLGFVDVPGHQRFIHNMVAGVAAQQFALLVIAADDGPMPQTAEHLQIMGLLGITRGAIALTKIDRVSADQQASVQQNIQTLVADTFLQGAPVFPVSAITGDGITTLAEYLWQQKSTLESHSAGHISNFRMPIDRVFTVKGSGLVVTGTVHNGEVMANESLLLFPGNKPVRVRSIHRQNQPDSQASAGDRTAINLLGASTEDVKRGCWLLKQPSAHNQIVIDLAVATDFGRPVRHWTPVHIYHGTSHTTAHVAFLEGTRLAPGERADVELVCDEPLCAVRGERLVLRDQGLEATLGGGVVIDNAAFPGRRRSSAHLAEITACAQPTAIASFEHLLALGPLSLHRFSELWGVPVTVSEQLAKDSSAVVVDDNAVHPALYAQWQAHILSAIDNADSSGLRLNSLPSEVAAPFARFILSDLVARKKLMVSDGRYRFGATTVSLDDAEQALLAKVQPLLQTNKPPSLGDMSKQLGIAMPTLQSKLKSLVGKKALVRVSDTRYFLPAQIMQLAELAEQTKPLSVKAFRDAANTGRNTAIEVLEYFDAKGFTKRQDNERIVIGVMAKLE